MMFLNRAVVVYAAVLSLCLSGCFAHVQHLPKADPAKPSFPPLAHDADTLIGVALSGGGSRAAYFGAAGLEALAHLRTSQGPSLLEQIAYLSSVSGGSVASSYFATQKPSAGVPVLNRDGSLTPEYGRFLVK
jgi:NTE family protein